MVVDCTPAPRLRNRRIELICHNRAIYGGAQGNTRARLTIPKEKCGRMRAASPPSIPLGLCRLCESRPAAHPFRGYRAEPLDASREMREKKWPATDSLTLPAGFSDQVQSCKSEKDVGPIFIRFMAARQSAHAAARRFFSRSSPWNTPSRRTGVSGRTVFPCRGWGLLPDRPARASPQGHIRGHSHVIPTQTR